MSCFQSAISPFERQPCPELYQHRRAIRFPGVFVGARPLHHDRLAWQFTCQQRCIQGDIVRAIMSIATGAFGMDHANPVGINMQYLCQRAPQHKWRLRMRPDG